MPLEPVLPGHDQSDRRTVLVHQRLAVHADRQNRQRMLRLVHPKPFHIRPLEHGRRLARHLGRPEQRGELDERRLCRRLSPLDDLRERDANPGDHHRPRLDAAQTIDALLELNGLDEVLEMVVRRLVAEAIDLDGPGAGLQRSAIRVRIALAGAELVEVVVPRNLFESVQLLVGRNRLFLIATQGRARSVEGAAVGCRLSACRLRGAGQKGCGRGDHGCTAGDPHEFTPARYTRSSVISDAGLSGLRLSSIAEPFNRPPGHLIRYHRPDRRHELEHRKGVGASLDRAGAVLENARMPNSPDTTLARALAVAVHEIRNPLSVVQGWIGTVLREGQAHRSADSAQRMVRVSPQVLRANQGNPGGHERLLEPGRSRNRSEQDAHGL